MKKLVLLGIGLACAAAFIGFDAVGAFFDNARGEVRSRLMSPEVELQAQISGATELAEKCGESVVYGRIALARLDASASASSGAGRRRSTSTARSSRPGGRCSRTGARST